MKNKSGLLFRTRLGMTSLPLLLASAGLAHADLHPLQIERAGIQGAGATALFADIAYETGREMAGLEYDNFRLGALGVRHGLGDAFEVGGYLVYNSNSEDDTGAPDNSGLEGLSLYGKLQLNSFMALTVGTTFAGKDDVAPYPNDGLDFFINLPMQRALGNGLLYGELGYTIQDQDIGGTYINYGVGYAFPLQGGMTANVELFGDENPIGSNHMSLLGGVSIPLANNMRVSPYLSVGLYDPSPDFAVGATFEVGI